MRVLADPSLRQRVFLCALLCAVLCVVWPFDPSVALAAGTGKIKLASLGQSVFYSFSEFSTWAGAGMFAAGAIPMMAGREVSGFAMGAMGTGAGVACIQYIPDVISLVGKTNGALL